MDPILPLLNTLNADGRLRVWSLVITVFGDLVQHRGGEISTARLNPLLARVGVEAGALRTALSRLTTDGWVERQRKGRFSLYRLSASGQERFGPATRRIYAPPQTEPVTEWMLVIDTSRQPQLLPAGAIPDGAHCVVAGRLEHLSDAYRASLVSSGYTEAVASLRRDLDSLGKVTLTGLDAAAARILLIHRWRRIVLRHPEPVAALLDGPDPRAAVAAAYATLIDESEGWLDASDDGATPLPAADASFAMRFRSGGA